MSCFNGIEAYGERGGSERGNGKRNRACKPDCNKEQSGYGLQQAALGLLKRLLKPCVSRQEKLPFCNRNGAAANARLRDVFVKPLRGKIELAGPPDQAGNGATGRRSRGRIFAAAELHCRTTFLPGTLDRS